jgi:hypothetical protein
VSITVRALQVDPNGDRVIGEDVHDDGYHFETDGGELKVYHKNEDILAIYAPGSWFSAVDNNPLAGED